MPKLSRRTLLTLSSVVAARLLSVSNLLAAEGETSDWPQWRGPSRDGTRTGSETWPATLSDQNLSLQWRIDLGPSYSGPILAGNRVYTTETKDSKQELVHAFDRNSGEKLWQTEWLGALSVPFFARSNGSWIRSTPAVAGDNLYVGGMRDVLVCLDAANGETRWKLDFVEQFKTPLPAFGLVCSPLVVDGAVYLQAGAALAKVDGGTGEVIWRSLDDGGGMFGSAFSSPVFATLLGKPQIVVQTRELLAGVDPHDGSVLWQQKVPAFRGMNILTPSVWGDSIFTSTYGGKSFLFRLSQQGESIEVEEMWTNKVQGYMSSPVVYDNHLYLHLKNQRFTCIDLTSGESMWTTTPFGNYWSMVRQADRLLALDQKGELLYIRLTPEKFELLAKIPVSQTETWAHLAVSQDQLFIRELGALAAYQWK